MFADKQRLGPFCLELINYYFWNIVTYCKTVYYTVWNCKFTTYSM